MYRHEAWNATFLANAMREKGVKYFTADELNQHIIDLGFLDCFDDTAQAIEHMLTFYKAERCKRRVRNAFGTLVTRYRVIPLFGDAFGV
jgi:hypothetical protein